MEGEEAFESVVDEDYIVADDDDRVIEVHSDSALSDECSTSTVRLLDFEAVASLTADLIGSQAPVNGSSHLYQIRCCAEGVSSWQVLQPYSAFRELNSHLKKTLSQKGLLPDFPPKHYMMGSSSDSVVREREAGLVPVLQAFLEVRHSPEVGVLVLAFLQGVPLPGQLRSQGACHEGVFGEEVPIEELRRDFMRTFVSESSIFVRVHQLDHVFLHALVAAEEVAQAARGDVGAEKVSSIHEDFALQLNGVLSKAFGQGVSPGTIERLVCRMTVCCAVGFLQQLGLSPPVIHQPKYVISASSDAVRLVWWGFVGAPVLGDHPSRKHTPFCLRVESHNLLNSMQHTNVAPVWGYSVHHTACTDMEVCMNEVEATHFNPVPTGV